MDFYFLNSGRYKRVPDMLKGRKQRSRMLLLSALALRQAQDERGYGERILFLIKAIWRFPAKYTALDERVVGVPWLA